MRKHTLFLLAVLGAWALSGCKGNGGSPASGSAGRDSLNVNLADESSRLVNSFPSPVQLSALLKKAGAQYSPDLLNPQEKVTQYQNSGAKALNLGIFSADMAYSAIFEQRQKATGYLGSIRRLAGDLGLDGIFDHNLEARLKANEQNNDSLTAIFSETLARLKTRLHENQQPQLLNLMFAGGFVEGLHLALSTYQAKPNAEIANEIAELKTDLTRLLEYLKPSEGSDAATAQVAEGLRKLAQVYEKVNIEYVAPAQEAKATAAGGVIEVENENKISIQPETIAELQKTLMPVRQSIIQ